MKRIAGISALSATLLGCNAVSKSPQPPDKLVRIEPVNEEGLCFENMPDADIYYQTIMDRQDQKALEWVRLQHRMGTVHTFPKLSNPHIARYFRAPDRLHDVLDRFYVLLGPADNGDNCWALGAGLNAVLERPDGSRYRKNLTYVSPERLKELEGK